VASRGAEIGLRSEALPGLQSSLALWRLDLASELVFVGDAGDTAASRASRREGIEWNNHWRLDAFGWRDWLLDLDLSASRARFTTDAAEGNRVPGAVNRVASVGLAYAPEAGRWFGDVQLRYFGPRDLIEDGSQRSQATTATYLRLGYRPTRDTRIALDVFNLFDRKASDIDYFYTSRLAGEPAAGIADRHFHPVEPRTLRVSVGFSFR
jgi:outer membrane receptor protein involved in Fe transport